jgi:thiol:disulfide interchange protein DsbD
MAKFIWFIIVIGALGCKAKQDDLDAKTNLVEGIEWSKALDRPIFLHFTGYGSVGYNEFYNDFIPSSDVKKILNEAFVTIELHVDDRRAIQTSDTLNLFKFKFSDEGKERISKAKTIGDINAAIEIDWLKTNTQPLYLVVDSALNILVEPFGYTQHNRQFFLSKLDEGLNTYKKRK